MSHLPLTFVYAFERVAPECWENILDEFAFAGAKHLVLNSSVVSRMAAAPLEIKKLLRSAADRGLDFVDSHAPMGIGFDMNCPLENLRRQMILRHRLYLNIASEFGVDTMTIHTGNDHHYPDIPENVHYDNIRRTLDELLPEAEKCGVVIAMENIWFRVNTPDKILMLKKEYDTPFLGLCYDSGHANLLDKGRYFAGGIVRKCWGEVGLAEQILWEDQALEKMQTEIVCCHLHDNDGITDQHCMPGKGTLDWQKIVPQLLQAPKLKSIQCEAYTHRSGNTVSEIVASCRKILPDLF